MSNQSSNKKSVVVLGGGHAGTVLVQLLTSSLDAARYNITLITARPFFVFYPATLRLVTSNKHDLEGKLFMPYDHILGRNGKLVVGTAVRIEKRRTRQGGEVVLENDQRVPFDALIVATGSKQEGLLAFPETEGARDAFIARNRARIQAAKRIVLVGGGAIGIELAGEIKDAYPDTHVTVVHGGPKLLNDTYPDRYRDKLAHSLRARDVEVILNEYIDAIPEGAISQVTTRSGKTLSADLVLGTRGSRPNTAFLSSLGADTLSTAGYAHVRPTLQLRDHADVFAVGDVIEWREQKQAGKVYGHTAVAAANVKSVLEGAPARKVYKGGIEMIAVTNGKNGGVSYFDVLWGLILGNRLTRLVKSKTLLIPMARKGMGLID